MENSEIQKLIEQIIFSQEKLNKEVAKFGVLVKDFKAFFKARGIR